MRRVPQEHRHVRRDLVDATSLPSEPVRGYPKRPVSPQEHDDARSSSGFPGALGTPGCGVPHVPAHGRRGGNAFPRRAPWAAGLGFPRMVRNGLDLEDGDGGREPGPTAD